MLTCGTDYLAFTGNKPNTVLTQHVRATRLDAYSGHTLAKLKRDRDKYFNFAYFEMAQSLKHI